MTCSASTEEPKTNDFRLVEEAIRRATKSKSVPEHHEAHLRAALLNEISRGRRDIFSLVRAARTAIDRI